MKTQHHAEILEKIEELAEDTLVVMASQCINGRTDMDVYDAGLKIQDAGVIGAEDMHPELAYVKLMWSLGQSSSLRGLENCLRKILTGSRKVDRSIMSNQKLDEFDQKAKKFLDEDNYERLRDILREFALCEEAYDRGMELENPIRMLKTAGIDVENIKDFTEYRLAKALIREQVKEETKTKKLWR